jgi:hypothetical protein
MRRKIERRFRSRLNESLKTHRNDSTHINLILMKLAYRFSDAIRRTHLHDFHKNGLKAKMTHFAGIVDVSI